LTAVSTRAVDGGVVLQQVVRADAEEIELATERVHEVHRGRHLDHRAERRQPARRARAGEPRFLLGEDARDPAHLIEVRDHRDEDLHVALDLWIVEAGTTYDTPVRPTRAPIERRPHALGRGRLQPRRVERAPRDQTPGTRDGGEDSCNICRIPVS
jgi:hypothetical protein